MLREHIELFFDLGRLPHVIGIEEANVFPPGLGQAEVASGAHPVVPAVGMLRQPDSVIGCCTTASDLSAPVRRTVIDDDELPVLEALPLNTRDGLAQVRLAVVDDDDAGHCRRRHLRAMSPRRTRSWSSSRSSRTPQTGTPATVRGAWRAKEIPWASSDLVTDPA